MIVIKKSNTFLGFIEIDNIIDEVVILFDFFGYNLL